MAKKTVQIRWHDPVSEPSWKTIPEIKKWAKEQLKTPCVSSGRIVVSTRNYIVLASEFDGDESYGNYTLIYKSLIV